MPNQKHFEDSQIIRRTRFKNLMVSSLIFLFGHPQGAGGTPFLQRDGGTPSLQLPAGAEKIAVVKDKPKEIKLLDDELLVVCPTPFPHPCETRGGDVIGQPMPDDV